VVALLAGMGVISPAAAVALGWSDLAVAEAALRTALTAGATPIDRGMARLALTEGRITLTEGSLGAEAGLMLDLTGSVDLARDSLDLRVDFPVADGAPPLGLAISGPSRQPLATPKIAEWLRWRAENPP
jgi:hypothetical protein